MYTCFTVRVCIQYQWIMFVRIRWICVVKNMNDTKAGKEKLTKYSRHIQNIQIRYFSFPLYAVYYLQHLRLWSSIVFSIYFYFFFFLRFPLRIARSVFNKSKTFFFFHIVSYIFIAYETELYLNSFFCFHRITMRFRLKTIIRIYTQYLIKHIKNVILFREYFFAQRIQEIPLNFTRVTPSQQRIVSSRHFVRLVFAFSRLRIFNSNRFSHRNRFFFLNIILFMSRSGARIRPCGQWNVEHTKRV